MVGFEPPTEFLLTQAIRSLSVLDVHNILKQEPRRVTEETDPTSGRTPLHWATLQASNEIVSLLLQTDALVNVAEKVGGWTPLHLAVLTLNPDLCELLLSNGADPAILDKDNKSCYDLVVEVNDESFLDIFRKYDEDPQSFLKQSCRRKRTQGMLLGLIPPHRQ